MTLRRAVAWLLLFALVVFAGWQVRTTHFDPRSFARGLMTGFRKADPRLLLLAVLLIYSNNVIRALRWAVFLGPAWRADGRSPTRWWRLIGAQFIGFTGLAVLGRVGELIRPMLLARRTGLSFSSQIAVVAVERVFDLGAFATIFALNLMLAPDLKKLPFHEMFERVGLTVAILTLLLAGLVVAVRLAGRALAEVAGKVFGSISKASGEAARRRILSFRDGLDVVSGPAEFAILAGLSLLLWMVIALAYVAVLQAFPAPANALTVADCLIVMGFSVAGSVVQLPGVGGGAQLGMILALTKLFHLPAELATSAGLMVWFVGTWSIAPAGLLLARLEGISLRQVAKRSEAGA